MGTDIDLIKQLEREIGEKIEIRPDAGRHLKHPHGNARPKGPVRNSRLLISWFVEVDIQGGHEERNGLSFSDGREPGHSTCQLVHPSQGQSAAG